MKRTLAIILSTTLMPQASAYSLYDKFTSLEVGNIVSSVLCGGGAAWGAVSASRNKDIDRTWTTLGMLGVGCGVALGVNWFITPDKEKDRLKEIQSLKAALEEAQAQAAGRSPTLPGSSAGTGLPDSFAIAIEKAKVKEFSIEDGSLPSGLEFKRCGSAYHLSVTYEGGVDDPHKQSPKVVVFDEEFALINVGVLWSPEKCFKAPEGKRPLKLLYPDLRKFFDGVATSAQRRVIKESEGKQ